MRCVDARELLSTVLDDELPPEERGAVIGHLEQCTSCSSQIGALRDLKHFVARLQAEELPPAAVRTHIDAVRFARRKRAPQRSVRVAAAAMLLIALAAIVLSVRWHRDLSDAVAADHLKSNPAVVPPQVVTGSPAAIERFFAGATRFAPTVPRLKEAEVLGARLCHLDDQTAELIFYRHKGRNVSLFVTAVPPRKSACTTQHGLTVCREELHGLGVYAVSDLPEESLRRLLGNS